MDKYKRVHMRKLHDTEIVSSYMFKVSIADYITGQ